MSEDLKSFLTNPDDWLYLFIRITDVKQVAHSGYKNTKDFQRGIQRSISKSELKPVGKNQLLVISDKYGYIRISQQMNMLNIKPVMCFIRISVNFFTIFPCAKDSS